MPRSDAEAMGHIPTLEDDGGQPRCAEGVLHVKEPHIGRVTRLRGPLMRLGSGRENHLVIEDPYVSRVHARLEWRRGEVWIVDEGSRNGTWVNGLRVERCRIEAGAQLLLGKTHLVVAGPEPEVSSQCIIGEHPAMRRVFEQVQRLGRSHLPVLILGETGTGKELVARALHEVSPVSQGPFEPVNCGAIPAELAEAELFGHEQGAFTGAQRRRKGAVERADGGTLFLDEIGEMPLALQPKLLRVLEQGEVQRVGGERRFAVQVRVLSATCREILSGPDPGFRPDLFFRLAGGIIRLPPLRERASDIPLLVSHFLHRIAAQNGLGRIPRLEATAIEQLQQKPWPGNVRQLYRALERATVESGPRLGPESFYFLDEEQRLGTRACEGVIHYEGRSFDEIKGELFLTMVDRHRGNRTAAAAALGIPRSTFFDELKRVHRGGRR